MCRTRKGGELTRVMGTARSIKSRTTWCSPAFTPAPLSCAALAILRATPALGCAASKLVVSLSPSSSRSTRDNKGETFALKLVISYQFLSHFYSLLGVRNRWISDLSVFFGLNWLVFFFLSRHLLNSGFLFRSVDLCWFVRMLGNWIWSEEGIGFGFGQIVRFLNNHWRCYVWGRHTISLPNSVVVFAHCDLESSYNCLIWWSEKLHSHGNMYRFIKDCNFAT